MLLNKFIRHIFTQNWGLLFTEFLVVVFGLIVGLQANDWYEERERAEQAEYHLHFLREHLESAINSSREEVESNSKHFHRAGRALDMLSMPTWTEGEFEEFNSKIFSSFFLWGPKKRPVALRRMTDDGKIDLVRDRAIQSAILSFEDDYIEAIEQTKTAYSTSAIVTLEITNRIFFVGGKIRNDKEELLNDRDLYSALRNKVVWQRIQLGVLEDLQKSRIQLKEILDQRGLAVGEQPE